MVVKSFRVFFEFSVYLLEESFRPNRMEQVSTANGSKKCLNIRSKQHPDVQCNGAATHGDYCYRHWKKPVRFSDGNDIIQRKVYTRKQAIAVKKLQKFWRLASPLYFWKSKGPAWKDSSLAQNSTEVYSLENTENIPKVFRFSFSDLQKNIWLFDIRSLAQLMAKGQILENPYTREPLQEFVLQNLRNRINFLRKHKQNLFYIESEAITPEQNWNQKVLDVFIKIEALGYLLNTEWFNKLTIHRQKKFYRALYELWTFRLNLRGSEREEICPGYLLANTRLFRYIPDDAERTQVDIKWWRRLNLTLIQNLVTRSSNKAHRGLGALYVLMGLVQVSEEAADAYPWIYDSLGL